MPNSCCMSHSMPLKRCKSRELRGGIFFLSCDCVKRNGLQDRCPRTGCGKNCISPHCPIPCCCPSQHTLRFMNMTMGISSNRSRSSCNSSNENNMSRCNVINTKSNNGSWNTKSTTQVPLEATMTSPGCLYVA